MKKIKVMTVFGTRPEAVKLCPVINELENNENLFESTVCITAQHRELLDQVLGYYQIVPDFDLDIMKHNQSLTELSSNVMIRLDQIFKNVQPDLILVHGDTLTTFVTSYVAFINRIKVGHVEAGLRTWNKLSPFPEEVNRQLVGVISSLHFAPTQWAKKNLLKENKDNSDIFVTGNTAIDGFKYTVKQTFSHCVIDWAKNKRLILMSAHRRESQGEPHKQIFRAIKRISVEFDDVAIVYPVHPSEAVKKPAYEILGNLKNVKLISPMSVFDWQNLYPYAYLVVTDSGGVQEEAPFFNIPTLVIRDNTERPEGVQTGALKIVGTKEGEVYQNIKNLLLNQSLYNSMSCAPNPYGDGHASERIVESILYHFDYVNERPVEFDFHISNEGDDNS